MSIITQEKKMPNIFDQHWSPILMYHRVDYDEEGLDWVVAPPVFERQLAFLRRQGYTGLTASQLADGLEGKIALPPKPVLITFDDGYTDNYTTAWPLLQKYGFNATIFLVSDYIGQDNRFDRGLSRLCPTMPLEQIRAMQKGGIEFGSHTCNHLSLPTLSEAERTEELERSRRDLSGLLDREVVSFAYPYSELNDTCEAAVEAAGYRTAVAGTGPDFRRYRLSRQNLKSQPTLLIALKTSAKVRTLRRTKLYMKARQISNDIRAKF